MHITRVSPLFECVCVFGGGGGGGECIYHMIYTYSFNIWIMHILVFVIVAVLI